MVLTIASRKLLLSVASSGSVTLVASAKVHPKMKNMNDKKAKLVDWPRGLDINL
jgi:hypothetical protein